MATHRRTIDKRGNAASRRRRKERMLAHFGDGVQCACTHCRTPLTFATVEADRIKPGASYRFENVQPACRSCNARRGNDMNWSYSEPRTA